MQKKIIVLAIAAALTAPALAFAEATVFGQANLAINRVNDGNANSTTTNELSSYGSRLGLKGSEDLGTGMSVVWQMEGSVDVDTGASFLFDRNTYLGLSSAGMGTILGGHYDSPYKISTRRLDIFGDTVADNRRLMGIGHDVGRANSLVYLSPSWGGFSIAAGTAFGAETAGNISTGAGANNTKGTTLSLAGMYEAGPLYATLAYDNVKFGSPASGTLGGTVNDESKAWKAGVGYAMDAITLNAVIEKPKTETAAVGATPASSSSGTNLYLAGKFAISTTDAVKLAYTKKGDTSGNTDNVKQYAIGYDHNLSSNTTVYALYTKVTDNGRTGSGTLASPYLNNPDPSFLSVGMKHMF